MSRRPARNFRLPTHKVVWSPRSLWDLDAAHDFLATLAPSAAARLKLRLRKAAQSLEFLPYRNTAENGIYSERVPPHHTLFYAIEGTTVVILEVYDGRQG